MWRMSRGQLNGVIRWVSLVRSSYGGAKRSQVGRRGKARLDGLVTTIRAGTGST